MRPKKKGDAVEFIQIGASQPKPLTIREMFEQMAEREAEMIRAARRAGNKLRKAVVSTDAPTC